MSHCRPLRGPWGEWGPLGGGNSHWVIRARLVSTSLGRGGLGYPQALWPRQDSVLSPQTKVGGWSGLVGNSAPQGSPGATFFLFSWSLKAPVPKLCAKAPQGTAENTGVLWDVFWFFFWLHWVFVPVRRLSLVAASGGNSSLRCAGFPLWWLLLLQSTGSRRAGSVVVEPGSRAQAQ